MKKRPFECALALLGKYAVAGAFTASLLTTSRPAEAQPAEAPAPAAPAPATEAAPKPAAPAAPPGQGTPPAEPPAANPAPASEPPAAAPPAGVAPSEPAPPRAETPKVSAETSASANASQDAAALSPKAPVESSAPARIGDGVGGPTEVELELLPASAYPNTPLPGIPNGSLSLVINRLQWPYMPSYGTPRSLRVGFSGYGWLDANYRKIKAGLSTEDNQTEYRSQGRFAFRITPTYNVERDYFIQANTEFIANADQDHTVTNYVDVDDFWIRLGRWKHFDVQVGRMQGFEVYHFGMGLDLNTFERQGAVSFSKTPVQPYGLSDLWDRGRNNGALALHYYLPEYLRLEFLVRYGLSSQGSDIGMRPVAVLDLGWMKFKAGYEQRERPSLFDNSDARVETKGVGSSLQFVLDPWVELGAGIGHRVEDAFEQDGAVRAAASHTTLTYGGFLNARPYYEDWMVGVGYHYTDWENFEFDAFGFPETSTHHQMFGAVQYLLWDKLYIKYVLGYANGHIEERNDSDPNDNGFRNKSLSHRLRFMVFY